MLADAERTQLANHIADLEIALHVARDKMNGLAPISKLPPELLSRIFKIVRDNDIETHRTQKYLWNRVTHVCQYWRQAAHCCATLWSIIDFASVEMALHCVKLSKEAPLRVIVPTLEFTLDDKGIKDLIQVLTTESQRLRCIEFLSALPPSDTIWTMRVPPFLTQLAQITMPTLISFEFLPGFELSSSPPAHQLPTHFLMGLVPQLQHIKLRGLQLPWTSPLLDNISTLVLEAGCTSMSTSTEFFAALQRMPTLSVLKIDHLPEDLDEFSADITAILPCITLLDIRSSFERCTGMLNHINLPLSATLKIFVDLPYWTIHMHEVDSSPFADLMGGIVTAWLSNPLSTIHPTQHSLDPHPAVIRSAYIYRSSDEWDILCQNYGFGDINIRTWLHDDRTSNWNSPSPCTLRFLQSPQAHFEAWDITDVMMQGFVPNLQGLESFASSSLSCKEKTISQLPMLSSLDAIDSWNERTVCTDFFLVLEAMQGPQDFPRLSNITFRGAEFCTISHQSFLCHHEESIHWDSFVEFCTSYRTIDGVPLKCINLLDALDVDKGRMVAFSEAMKAIGAEVEWSMAIDDEE